MLFVWYLGDNYRGNGGIGVLHACYVETRCVISPVMGSHAIESIHLLMSLKEFLIEKIIIPRGDYQNDQNFEEFSTLRLEC